MKKEKDYIAKLVVYGLENMGTKDYRRLLEWLEARYEEAQKNEYRKEYSNTYTSRLLK